MRRAMLIRNYSHLCSSIYLYNRWSKGLPILSLIQCKIFYFSRTQQNPKQQTSKQTDKTNVSIRPCSQYTKEFSPSYYIKENFILDVVDTPTTSCPLIKHRTTYFYLYFLDKLFDLGRMFIYQYHRYLYEQKIYNSHVSK